MDLTTLLAALTILCGLIVGDAVMNGNTLQVQISMPPAVAQTGFTSATAEQVFQAETARIGQSVSVVPIPSVELGAQPGVFGSLAKPLNLDGVVIALRKQFRPDGMAVIGSVVEGTPRPRLDLLAVVTAPHRAPTKLVLSQPDGDAAALMERAAAMVLEEVAPFRVALAQYSEALHGDLTQLAQAKATAIRALGRPWMPIEGAQRALLHNLLGTIAIIEGDRADADRHFMMGAQIADSIPPARGTIMLNQAFLAISDKKPDAALALYSKAVEESKLINLPKYHARLETLGGLVAWSNGDLDTAEARFRDAAHDLTTLWSPHFYLRRLLVVRGKQPEAWLELAAEMNNEGDRTDTMIPALLLSTFEVDPVKGGMTRR